MAGGAGIAFDHENLSDRMREVLAMPEQERELWRSKAMERVRERYDWEAVTDAYEILFESLVKK